MVNMQDCDIIVNEFKLQLYYYIHFFFYFWESYEPPRNVLFKYQYCSSVPDIGIIVRVFANGLGDLDSIPGRVIPNTQKMVLDAILLNNQHYKVHIKGKVEQSRESSSASPPTTRCSSYRKRSLRVNLDYSCQLYLLLLFYKNSSDIK